MRFPPRRPSFAVTTSFGFRVDDAVTKRFGAEAAEHDRVHCADSSAGEHRVRELGDHGQVDTDAVAFAHAQRLQRIGGAANCGLEIPEGDVLVLARLVLDEDNRGLFGVFCSVPVDTVDRGVEAAAREPNELAWPMFFEHLVRFVEPVELVAFGAPELFVRGDALVVEALVFL